jgi:aminopeptidase N
MLRGVLRAQDGAVDGDDRFFALLHAYATHGDFVYGSVSTTDFVRFAEEALGRDLHWYFTPWLYGTEHPALHWSWSAPEGGAPGEVYLHLLQTQAGPEYPHGSPFPEMPDVFEMPWEVRLYGAGGESTVVYVTQDHRAQDFTVNTAFQVTRVTLDPDQWVLRELTFDPAPAASRLGPIWASPSGRQATLNYAVAPGRRADITLYAVNGGLVLKLVEGEDRPGWHVVQWDGRDGNGRVAAKGVYFVRLSDGQSGETSKLVLVGG